MAAPLGAWVMGGAGLFTDFLSGFESFVSPSLGELLLLLVQKK